MKRTPEIERVLEIIETRIKNLAENLPIGSAHILIAPLGDTIKDIEREFPEEKK